MLRRPQNLRPLRGRMAARRPGAPLGAARHCRTSRSTSSRPAARPAFPRAASSSRTSASITRCSARPLPEKYFPKGANWLMLGPSGPRRLRLAVEHLCQHRGGICFCVDLDPRWVVKLIKKGWMEHLKAYKEHVIDQALTILKAGHDIKCMFTTPKLLEALAGAPRKRKDRASRKPASPASSRGGTELTPQWTRFAIEELLGRRLHDADLRQHADGPGLPDSPSRGRRITRSAYYAPQPRAVRGGRRFRRPGQARRLRQGLAA